MRENVGLMFFFSLLYVIKICHVQSNSGVHNSSLDSRTPAQFILFPCSHTPHPTCHLMTGVSRCVWTTNPQTVLDGLPPCALGLSYINIISMWYHNINCEHILLLVEFLSFCKIYKYIDIKCVLSFFKNQLNFKDLTELRDISLL